jgi:hypothetical protein
MLNTNATDNYKAVCFFVSSERKIENYSMVFLEWVVDAEKEPHSIGVVSYNPAATF